MTPGQSEEARAELARARRALGEARLLLEADASEGAASRLYYSVFHAARGALLVRGRSSKTHSGQISLFTEIYGAAPVLGRLLELRARADYEFGELHASREAMEGHAQEAESFIERCEEIVSRAIEGQGPDEPDPPPDY